MERYRVYYKGEGGGFPQIRAVVSIVCLCCPWLVLAPKVLQLRINHLVWVLCRPMWVSEACQLFLVHPETPTCPFTLKVLWAKERAPTPPSSVVFYLDSHLSLSRSWEWFTKGRCLVISLFYHTNISFIINSLSYNIMYSSWIITSYSCPLFTVLMWSYHWQSRYPFVSMPLEEWTYNSPRHISRYYCYYYFGKWSTCWKGGFPLFPLPHSTTSGYSYH